MGNVVTIFHASSGTVSDYRSTSFRILSFVFDETVIRSLARLRNQSSLLMSHHDSKTLRLLSGLLRRARRLKRTED
jgi:hypothetical protein